MPAKSRSLTKTAKIATLAIVPSATPCRTEGVTTTALAPRTRADTNAGLGTVDDVRLASRQQQGGRRSRARTCSQMKGGLSERVRSLPARPRSPRFVKT
jgi:hypothetical protein